MDLSKALESVQSIKLRGGIFGKSSLIVIFLSIAVASICISLNNIWVALILSLPWLGISFYTIKRCLDFAEKNPQAAIMDGAELLIHEQIQLGMKGKGEIVTQIANLTSEDSIEYVPSPESIAPDLPPTEEPPSISHKDVKEVQNG